MNLFDDTHSVELPPSSPQLLQSFWMVFWPPLLRKSLFLLWRRPSSHRSVMNPNNETHTHSSSLERWITDRLWNDQKHHTSVDINWPWIAFTNSKTLVLTIYYHLILDLSVRITLLVKYPVYRSRLIVNQTTLAGFVVPASLNKCRCI